MRAGDVGRGALALHARGTNDEMRVRIAAAEHFDDVANRRAVERGDDADLAGQRRERALARGVEEPFGLEPALQLIERELQRAEPMRLHALAHDLVLAFRLVYADAPAHDDVQAVFWFELQRADVRLEHDRFDLGAGIFQREIEVAGVPEAAVGNFCLDPDLGVGVFQNAADVRGEVADSQDGSLREPQADVSGAAFGSGSGSGSGSGRSEEIKLRAHVPVLWQTDSVVEPTWPFRSPRLQQSGCR